jgi:hypothetical protein
LMEVISQTFWFPVPCFLCFDTIILFLLILIQFNIFFLIYNFV